jgi:hypothetical protein
LLRCLKHIVNVLHAFSTSPVLSDGGSLVSPAIFFIIQSMYLIPTPRCLRSQRRFFPVSSSFCLCVSLSFSPPLPLSHLELLGGRGCGNKLRRPG